MTSSLEPSNAGLSEAHGPEVTLMTSFRRLLSTGAEKSLEEPALISLYQSKNLLPALMTQSRSDVDHLVWSYKELQEAASSLAVILHGYGVKHGSTIACFLWNSVELTVLCWAAAALNASFAPVDPRSIERSSQLKHILETLTVDVIVVQHAEAASTLEKSAPNALRTAQLKVLCEGSTNATGWHCLAKMHKVAPITVDWNVEQDSASGDDIALILFTSGTTSLPKACGHTANNLSSQSEMVHKTRRLSQNSKVLLHSPIFHIAAFYIQLCAWRVGATLVVPSPRFDAAASWDAVESQGCTFLFGTPTMVSSMFNQRPARPQSDSTAEYISIGAEMVTPDLIKRVKDQIGPRVMVWSGWGMTEGIGIISWDEDEDILPRQGIFPIGKVMPGAKIRICKEGSQKPLSRGEEGELHCAGTSIICGYLNESTSDRFYREGKDVWLATGDRALMDVDGRVYIFGRYKDIIVRGGENISPAALESCLDTLGGLKTQVVGVPDPVMGEVPFAVVKNFSNTLGVQELNSLMHERIVQELGTDYALAGVLTLDEMGSSDFPLTGSGKIRKVELKALVSQYLQKRDKEQRRKTEDSTISQIRDIWSRVLGYTVEQDAGVLADSLTIMRFCYEVEKTCGKRISPAEIYANATINDQARLLDDKIARREGQSIHNLHTKQSQAPPSTQDMIPTFDSYESAEKAPKLAKAALEALDLSWDGDVEAVYRNNDTIRDFWSSSQRPCSSNIRWAYEVQGVTLMHLRKSLEEALARNSTFRSIIVNLDDNMPIHMVVRPSQHWFDRCIATGKEVDKVDDVRSFVGDMDLEFGSPPGPLFRALIVPIHNSNNLGLVMSIHHSTYDAFSMSAFFRELDTIIDGQRNKLSDRVPFHFYADAYNSHKHGLAAMESVRNCASRLEGVGNVSKEALWPVQKSAEWLTGDDTGWRYRNGELGRPEERSVCRIQQPERATIIRTHTCAHLNALKRQHSIDASSILKAAVTLFNTSMTGHSQAVFCNLDSARQWPFLENWITDRLPNPLAIAGPTMGCTINVLPVDNEETTLRFLTRVQEDQIEASLHANAPFSAVMKALGDEKGQIIHDVARRQVYNWDSTVRSRMSNSLRSLNFLGRRGWLDLGVFWNFGLLDDETLMGFILYDDAQMSYSEAENALDKVFEIMHWMTAPQNWEANVGSFRQARS